MLNFKLISKKAGFTLIELLISISVMGILVGMGGDIFATLIRAYKKAELFALAEAKGNNALTLLEQDVRSAVGVNMPGASSNGNTEKGNTLEVYLPQSTGGTKTRKYVFVTCDSNSKGSITLDGKPLVDTGSSNLLGSTLAIKKMNVGCNDIDYFVHTYQNIGDVRYDLLTISFAINVGGSDPCDDSKALVKSYFQTTVNLRGGLPY